MEMVGEMHPLQKLKLYPGSRWLVMQQVGPRLELVRK